ncbi:MAG: hypothetical protein WCD20_19800 [Rhodomicrobium sp.]
MKISARVFSGIVAGIFAVGCGFAGQSPAAEFSKSPSSGCASAAPRVVHRNYIRRDVVEQGVYAVGRTPSEYGWVVSGNGAPRRILLRPYKNIAQFEPPYVAWYREHLTIQPEVQNCCEWWQFC